MLNVFKTKSPEERAEWERRFAWVPDRCSLTGRLIWLRWAYRGVAYSQFVIQGSVPVQYTFWHLPDEHLLWVLGR